MPAVLSRTHAPSSTSPSFTQGYTVQSNSLPLRRTLRRILSPAPFTIADSSLTPFTRSPLTAIIASPVRMPASCAGHLRRMPSSTLPRPTTSTPLHHKLMPTDEPHGITYISSRTCTSTFFTVIPNSSTEKRFTSPFFALLSRSDRSFATATPSLSVMLNGAGMPQSRSAPPASSTYMSSGSSSTMSIPGTALTAKSSAHSAEPSSFTIVLTVFFIRSTPQKSTLEQNSMVLIV